MNRNILDIFMYISLLTVMGYRLTGNHYHELLGIVFAGLAIWHIFLNRDWFRGFYKGRQSLRRLLATFIVMSLIACISISLVSGLLTSRYLLPHYFNFSRPEIIMLHKLHFISSYLAFILSGIHLGLHWQALWLKIKKRLQIERFFRIREVGIVIAMLIISFGMNSSIGNSIGDKLMAVHMTTMRSEGKWIFLIDFTGIFAMYTAIGFYVNALLGYLGKRH